MFTATSISVKCYLALLFVLFFGLVLTNDSLALDEWQITPDVFLSKQHASPPVPILSVEDSFNLTKIAINTTDLTDNVNSAMLNEKKTGYLTAYGNVLQFNAQLEPPRLATYINKKLPNVWKVTYARSLYLQDNQIDVNWQTTEVDFVSKIIVTPYVQNSYKNKNGVIIIQGGVNFRIPIEEIKTMQTSGKLVMTLRDF